MSDPEATIYNRFLGVFTRDVLEVAQAAKSAAAVASSSAQVTCTDDSHLLSVNIALAGKPRTTLRGTMKVLVQQIDVQLPVAQQLRMYGGWAAALLEAGELVLSGECLDLVLHRCDSVGDEFNATRIRAETVQKNVQLKHAQLVGSSKYSRIAPIVVSQLLVILQDLRASLEILFELTTKQQEELAWLVLNGCKLVLKISQPLIWLSCGKYVSESLVFAGVCLESVINLCTTRHLIFRTKLYVSAFYATLVQGTSDEAQKLLKHATDQIKDLREREEMDLPIPQKVQVALLEAEADLSVLRALFVFWTDSDALEVADENAARTKYSFPAAAATADNSKSFAERCLAECVRVQQLSAGNANEPWRKRSSSLLKASWKCLSNYPIPSLEATSYPLSLECLIEVATIAIFDTTEGTPIPDFLQKLWEVSDILVGADQSDNAAVTTSATISASVQEIALLRQLTIITDMGEDSGIQRLAACIDLAQKLEKFFYSPQVRRRLTLLRRVAVGIWSRYIYPLLQKVISADQSPSTLTTLIEMTPGLLSAVRVLDLTGLEDPLFLGSVSLTCSIVLKHLGDMRAAISLLRQALDTLDEHRAVRVDVALHMPEDARDVSALQRGSFTTRAEASDWFHSIKRLGAHAFAGFGIFGASSSADRTDQALAELHTDMTALYFRYELEYAIKQKQAKLTYQAAVRARKDAKGKPAPTQPGLSTSSVTATGDEGSETEATAAGGSAQDLRSTRNAEAFSKTILASATAINYSGVKTDSLSCVPAMKSWCGKNSYARCLLFLEMARVEISESKRMELLEAARQSVEEAEAKEQVLKDSFQDLTVVTNKEVKSPIILARSHRFIYVVPVGNRKAIQRAKYYRIFAKEFGSGTSVSLTNDDLPGCEKQLLVGDMRSPSSCAVKIERLRSGERYVFGYAAFSDNDKVLGGISPTSVSVDAVNPLPTLLLWSFLNQVSFEINALPLGKLAANMVCQRFFLVVPRSVPITMGKGINLFLDEDPSFCMLAVQQSSPLLLANFVMAFLSLQVVIDKPPPGLGSVHFDLRKDAQISTITALRRAAIVSIIACYSTSYELVVRSVLVGYDLASDLLLFDEMHLSSGLQGPLLMLLVALQTVPKRFWHDLEHKLYCRLLQHSVKLAILNRNVASVIPVLAQLYPETGNAADIAASSLTDSEVEMQYTALKSIMMLAGGVAKAGAPSAEAHINTLLEASVPTANTPGDDPEAPGGLWKLSIARRTGLLQLSSLKILNVAPEALALSSLMKESPDASSDLLSAVVVLGKEAVAQGFPALVSKALTAMPLFDKLFSSNVQEADKFWQFNLLQPLPPGGLGAAMAAAAAAAAAAAPVKGAKAAPAPSAPVVEVASDGGPPKPEVPLRFTETSAEEEKRQLGCLAEIANLLACTYVAAKKEHYPKSPEGPEEVINPSLPSSFLPEAVPVSADAASEPEVAGIDVQAEPEVEYIKNMCAAISLYSESERASAAVHSAVQLWNFLLDKFVSPKDFASMFNSKVDLLLRTASSLLSILEAIAGVERTAGVEGEEGEDVEPEAEQVLVLVKGNGAGIATRAPLRIIKENLYAVRNMGIFLIKVLWLHRKYLEAVDIGSRYLYLFVQKTPEFAKVVGDVTLPLLIHAQEELIASAEGVLAEKRKVMDACVTAFEEYMKKKRRKKTRLVKLEKDDDELQHDAEVAVIQETVDAATNALDICKARLAALKHQQKRFDTISSTGVQLLDKVRKLSQQLVEDCKTGTYGVAGSSNEGGELDYSALSVGAPALCERLEMVLDQFEQVAHFLREKKDRNTLIEALKEQGDLLLLFGRIDAAKAVWHDGIDGFFNVMDAMSQWNSVAQSALANLSPGNVVGFLPAVVILGKLSRYCVPGDRDMKAVYCRMAAILCRAPYMESHGHPSTLAGFAAYNCRDLDGLSSLTVNLNKLSSRPLAVALDEILRVLCAERCRVEALPVVVLLEYLHAYYTCSANQWLVARLTRVRLLIDSHFFAQAASMLASIKPIILSILSRSYGSPLAIQMPPQTVEEFDTRENGLDLFGQVPFLNHLPPAHELNVKAMAWIAALPEDFKQFAAPYIVELPIPVLSEEEQRAKDAADAAAAAAAAEAAAKAKKGAKGAPELEVAVSKNPTAPLFPASLQRELMIVCSQMLVELSISDAKVTTSFSSQLVTYGTQGLDMLTKVKELLALEAATTTPMGDACWISQFGRCNVLQAKVFIARRKFKSVRASLMSLLQTLQKEQSSSGLLPEAKFEKLDLWLTLRDLSTEVSERQARFQDAIKGATQAATEASSNCCGFWLRLALVRRAIVNYKLGKLNEALTDCEAVINIYSRNVQTDSLLVRCLVLKVSVLREMNATASPAKVVANMSTCLGVLREALKMAETLATLAGFLGADANITYSRADTLVMKHHLLPSVLHNLTNIHPNEPVLTIAAKINHKILGGVMATTKRGRDDAEYDDILPFREGGKWGLRPGPVDASETEYSPSEFANIHLQEVKTLALVYTAMCSFLDDVRLSGAQTTFDPRERESLENMVVLETELLLREQTAAGEDALKVLRHAVYIAPTIRSFLLLSVGKTRYAALKNSASSNSGTTVDGNIFLSPLRASLEIALAGPHPWEVMRNTFVQLVECYADRSLEWGEDGEQRMKMALQYLISAIKVSNQLRTITNDVIGLSADKSFSTAVPETITLILAAVTSSSATLPSSTVKEPVDPKAKAPAKGAPPPTAAGPDGRDALFLLSGMIRESDGLWLDSFERDDRTDLHLLMKKTFPVYAAKCTLAALPSPDAPSALQVPQGAVLSLYCSAKMPEGFPAEVLGSANPGLYSHVAAYFVLGARMPAGGAAAVGSVVKNPQLTKIVLLRRDVLRVEKTLRDIRDKVADFKAKGNTEGLAACAATLARCVQLLLNLLSQGFIDTEEQEAAKQQERELMTETEKKNDPTPRVAFADPATPEGGIKVGYSPATGIEGVTITLDDAVIGDLADLFSQDKDMDAVSNNTVCCLLRGALGFRD